MKELPKDYSLKMPKKLQEELNNLSNEKFGILLEKLKINFEGSFTKEEKINLLKNQGQNKINKELKLIK